MTKNTKKDETWMNGFPPISFNGKVSIQPSKEERKPNKNMVYTVDSTIKRNNDLVMAMLTLF